MSTKNIEQKFKKLDEIEHVLLRPGRYLGSIAPHTEDTYLYDEDDHCMAVEETTWCPALIKTFDEIISNSVDFSKTADGKHVSTIKVEIDKATGELSVFDDGGIPVVKHAEYGQYIPEMIFELRAGSNFNDEEDSVTTGQNGEGAGLTVIFSKSFNVKTADKKNQFEQTHTNNARTRSTPKIKETDKHFTKITWTPDYEKFGLEGLDDGNYRMLVKRVVDVAGCNPKLKVYLNGKQIKIKSFEDYIGLYTPDFVYEENQHWKVGVAKSEDGFKHVSFVNCTETKIGGNHVRYIQDQIVVRLREFFKKKHKVDVKPSDIANHMRIFIDATIIKPRYSSQTKEDLITEIKNFGTSIEISDKFINKLLKSDVIASILSWVEAKALQAEMAAAKDANKNVAKENPKHVPKFVDATEKDRSKCILFLTEGDSASGGIKNSKKPHFGLMPLRGKPLNAYELSVKEVLENKEFKNIMIITGLQIGVKVESIKQLRFGKIVVMSDQDTDGFQIRGLVKGLFYRFWPELFDLGVIHIFDTPLAKVLYNKKVLEFYSMKDLDEWRNAHQGEKFTTNYYKGLGSSDDKEWKEYLSDENFEKNLWKVDKISAEDKETFKLLFSKEKGMTDMRKQWLSIEEFA